MKLKTDPKHNQLGVQGTLSPLVREEIRALLKVADKDHSGAITFGVSNFLLIKYYIYIFSDDIKNWVYRDTPSEIKNC